MGDFGRKVWRRFRSWSGALFSLAGAHLAGWLWDRVGDLDLAHTVLGWIGLNFGMVAAFLLGPVFSLSVAGVAALGMIFIETPEFTAKHPHARSLGAVLFVMFASLIGGAFVFDQLLRTPKFAEVTSFYVTAHRQRHLTQDEKLKLLDACSKHRILRVLPSYISSSSDNESERFSQEIYLDLKKCGIDAELTPTGDQSPGEQGLMLSITDPRHPSSQASEFMSLLNQAGVKFTVEPWIYRDGWPPLPDFILFVTPSTPTPP